MIPQYYDNKFITSWISSSYTLWYTFSVYVTVEQKKVRKPVINPYKYMNFNKFYSGQLRQTNLGVYSKN